MSLSLELHLVSLIHEFDSRTNFGNFSLTRSELFGATAIDLVMFFGPLLLLFVSKLKASERPLLLARGARTVVALVVLLLLWSLYGLALADSREIISFACAISLFGGTYCISVATQSFKLALALLGLLTLYLLDDEAKRSKTELPLLLLLALTLGFCVLSATHLIILLLALEGVSLALYIMAATNQTQGGVTSAVKYFAYGTLGSVFLFWGAVHVYASVPLLSYAALQFLTEWGVMSGETARSNHLIFATTIMLVGFLIKLGASPLHQWVADVYAGVRLPVMLFFATAVKFVLFVAFVRIALMFPTSSIIIDFAALCSLVLGCYLTLQQTEIRRFLAYSSVVHVAFLLMGDVPSSFVYLITYVLSSATLIGVLSAVRVCGKELVYLSDLRYLRQYPWAMTLVVIALISASGLPPFAGFYGKFTVWVSLFEDVYMFNNTLTYVLLLTSIIVSLVTIFYYMRLVAYIFVGADAPVAGALTLAPHAGFVQQVGIVGAAILSLWTALHPMAASAMIWLSVSWASLV